MSVALIVLCVGCQRDLTRGGAKALIEKSDSFAKEQYDSFRVGHVYSLWEQRYAEMQEAGYVKIMPLSYGDARVVLTDKGRNTIRQLGGRIDHDSVTIPSGKQELIAVTGVSTDGKTAVADFSWRWNFNELSAVLNPLDVGAVRRGRAFLRLYDDGWRVMSIDYPK